MRRSLRKFSTIAAVSIIGWLGGAEKAQAQLTEGFSRAICQVFSVVPNLRAEGLAERIGNIRINCIPTIGRFLVRAEQVITQVNLGVTLNVSVTNRVDIYGASGYVDAVLTVNGQDSFRPLLSSESDYANFLGPIVGVNEPFPSRCPSYLNPNIASSPPFSPPFSELFSTRVFDPRWPCPQLGRKEGARRVTWDGLKTPFPGVDAENAQPPFNVVPSFPEITRIGVCTSLPTTPHLVVGRSACRVGVGPSLNRSWAQRSRPVVQAGRRAFPGDESVVD